MSRLARQKLFACMMVLSVLATACGASVSDEVVDPVSPSVETPEAPTPTDNGSAAHRDSEAASADLEDGHEDSGTSDASTETVEVAPTSTVNPARSRDDQSTSEQPDPVVLTPVDTIREVDFENFSYYGIGEWFDAPVTVTNGIYETDYDGPLEERFALVVGDIEFGDFDQDGREEAAVTTEWNGGGTGWFAGISFYRLVDGLPELVHYRPFGDRADGGIFDTMVVDNSLVVWSFSTTLGACCPNQIRKSVLVMGTDSVIEAAWFPTQTYLRFDGPQETDELKFLPGTSSGLVAAYPFSSAGTFILDALAGQRFTIDTVNGPDPIGLLVTHQATGQVVPLTPTATASGLVDVMLPNDGIYEVSMRWFESDREQETLLHVGIDEPAPSQLVTWTPTVDEVVISDEPFVRSVVAMPLFAATLPGIDGANQAMQAAAQSLSDPWIEDVTTFSEPQDDSSLEVTYSVRLVSDDLVSVKLTYFDYVCCRPYPNYGARATTIDLVTGQALEVGDILDTNRLEEITDLWIAALDKEQDFVHEIRDQLVERGPGFDSLAVVPNGVEFGTDRGSLGGGSIGTSTFVSFDDLGDLVNPSVVERARSGYTPTG